MTNRSATALAMGTTLVGVLPVFLVGALGALIRTEFDLSATTFGALVSVFFLSSGVLSAAAGIVIDKYGIKTPIIVAAVTASFSLTVLGALSRSPSHLFLILIIAGITNSLAQPAANLVIVRFLPRPRQGLIFGLKQAVVPAATLVGGVGLLAVVPTFGWRGVFVGTGAASLVFSVWIIASLATWQGDLKRSDNPTVQSHRLHPLLPLLLLSVAACLGAGAANALAAFYVQGVSIRGASSEVLGALLSLGGISSIAIRIGVGWYSDRRGIARFGSIGTMLFLGAAGLLMLSISQMPLSIAAVATLLGFGFGWGWAGILNYSTVLTYPAAPAGATGLTQAGIYFGGMLGPLLFGFAAEAVDFQFAWSVGSAALIVAGGLAYVSRRMFPVAK